MKKIKDTIRILKEMGLPKAQQNERSALTLLALIDLKKSSPWETAKKRIIRIHDILTFIEKSYGKRYAENTRETIRRQTLHQFVQAGIVAINPDDPRRPTNSPNTVYEITDEALDTIRKYNMAEWPSALKKWVSEKGKLIEKYGKVKKDNLLTLELSSGKAIKFSPGKHNELQIKIVKAFMPRFCPKAELVYVGDTARKILFLDEKILNTLGISITEHDKLPDVVLYDETKNHIFLIEAVTAHGPISPKRQIELENILKNCRAIKIYISVFPDFRELKRHLDNIAWESEGWVADNPDHMIHFNGPKFFSAY